MLVMTATPIPRSLALASYGDMDVSVLDEKPAGRKPIKTALIASDRIDEVVAHLARAVAEGRQAYWVCPLVKDSELIDYTIRRDRALPPCARPWAKAWSGWCMARCRPPKKTPPWRASWRDRPRFWWRPP